MVLIILFYSYCYQILILNVKIFQIYMNLIYNMIFPKDNAKIEGLFFQYQRYSLLDLLSYFMVATVVYVQWIVLPFAFVFSRFCWNFHWARRFHKWFLSFQWRMDGTNTKYILKSPFKSVFLWCTAISQQAHHLNNVYTSEIIVTAEERASAELKRFV